MQKRLVNSSCRSVRQMDIDFEIWKSADDICLLLKEGSRRPVCELLLCCDIDTDTDIDIDLNVDINYVYVVCVSVLCVYIYIYTQINHREKERERERGNTQ